MYRLLCECKFSFLLNKYLRVGMLVHMVKGFHLISNWQTVFQSGGGVIKLLGCFQLSETLSKVAVPFLFPLATYESSVCSVFSSSFSTVSCVHVFNF